jgi:Phage portal protein
MSEDNQIKTAFDPSAPADERFDAQSEAFQQHAPKALSDLVLPPEDLRPVIDWINNDFEDQAFAKAQQGANVIQFPGGRPQKDKKAGPRSVFLDDLQLLIHGEWYEKPGVLSPESLRTMIQQTPILSAILMTRVRQVGRFARVQEQDRGPGFTFRHADRDHELTASDQKAINELQLFFQHCGFEPDARKRRALKRDCFQHFMAKLVRDSLTLDMTAIETETKRDRKLGVDGLYALDAGTIRLVDEEGYRGDDSIIALQVVNGMVRTAYSAQDLIVECRNPRSDLVIGGYGLSETEILIKVVTGLLNVLNLNSDYFNKNSFPPGVLHLCGNFSNQDLSAFKRYWRAMVNGGGGVGSSRFAIPVMTSKDQESKASFEKFGVDVDDMLFGKFVTFLTSIACAVYGMDPAEISFESFSAGRSPLSGSDTEQKLASSMDKGLRPLLSYFEDLFTDYVSSSFGPWVFRWTGLDEEDEQVREERAKLVLTVNEVRAIEGYEKLDGPLGDAPVNQSLVGPWMQLQMNQGEGGEAEPEEEPGEDEVETEERDEIAKANPQSGTVFWKSMTDATVFKVGE